MFSRFTASGQPSQQRNAPKPPKDENSEQVKQQTKQQLHSALAAQEELGKSLANISLQADGVTKIKVDDKRPIEEVNKWRENLKKYDSQKETTDVKKKIHQELSPKVLGDRDNFISKFIKTEIARQVDAQVETQVPGFLPVPLNDQLQETRQRLDMLKKALKNSEARQKNSNIKLTERSDWQEPLGEVLQENGTRGELYPVDLITLYQYKEDEMKALMAGYRLEVDSSENSKLVNFNRFIQFIGVREPAEEYIELQ